MKKLILLIFTISLILSACAYQPEPEPNHPIQAHLEDLDYMLHTLETNFALLPVAYWARGIDYTYLANNAREAILAMPYPCEDMFLAIMFQHFYPLFNIGHFLILTPALYQHFLRYDQSAEIMRSPLSEQFYGPRLQDLSTFYDILGSVATQEIRDFFIPYESQVLTEILEEGRIAYISASSMPSAMQNQRQIFDFYREIRDYEH